MDIIIGLLIAGAFVIIIIALILAGDEKSRDTSDEGRGFFERHSKEKLSESEPFDDSRDTSDKVRGSLKLQGGKLRSKPFDYRASGWKELSQRQREQEKWRCQACNLSLHRHKYYLHTHHIWGTLFNELKDLRVLCIGCHSEQPGSNHYRLKGTRDYRGFIQILRCQNPVL